MALATKITLSDKELALMSDAGWILTKLSVIDKVYRMFGNQTDIISQLFIDKKPWSEELSSIPPKIFRGEHYRQLPYVILDYPRLFVKEDVFAVRTMFWWANFFSVSLLVSGRYKKLLEDTICGNKKSPSPGIFMCVNNTPWEHHLEPDNARLMDEMSNKEITGLYEQNDFVKLSIKCNLGDWDNLDALFADSYARLAAYLH